MSDATWTGVIPPVMTPMTDNGEVDVESLERLVAHLIDGGVHGLFALGSSGEVGYLSDADRRLVVETCVRVAAGRVPVVAGVNDMSANRLTAQIELVEDAGASAIVATAPFYVMPNPSEVEQHFRMIADRSALPVLAYDVPVRVHSKLDTAMLVRLGQEGVLAGVKDSSGDDVAFRMLVLANAEAGGPLSLFTGHEVVVDGALLGGADGVVPGLANVDPAGYVRLYEAARDGRWEDARVEQDRLARLFAIVNAAPGLGGEAAGLGAFKTSLALLGVITSNAMATPITRQGADSAETIRQILEAEVSVAG